MFIKSILRIFLVNITPWTLYFSESTMLELSNARNDMSNRPSISDYQSDENDKIPKISIR